MISASMANLESCNKANRALAEEKKQQGSASSDSKTNPALLRDGDEIPRSTRVSLTVRFVPGLAKKEADGTTAD